MPVQNTQPEFLALKIIKYEQNARNIKRRPFLNVYFSTNQDETNRPELLSGNLLFLQISEMDSTAPCLQTTPSLWFPHLRQFFHNQHAAHFIRPCRDIRGLRLLQALPVPAHIWLPHVGERSATPGLFLHRERLLF